MPRKKMEQTIQEPVAIDPVALSTAPTFKKYYVSDANVALLKACVDSNSAVLLIGETGTGKTTFIRDFASEKGKHLIRISVNGSMGIEEILGKWLVEKGTTKWQDGILTNALREGHWVVMDEINAALPEILFVLHSLLDDDRKIILPEKDNEVVVPHTEFRFFATMNPPEEYAGTKDMNKALMSRFTAVLDIEVLSDADEVMLLEGKGADTATAVQLVQAAQVLRNAKYKDDIFYFCSTRDLVQAVQLHKMGLAIPDAFLGSVVNKMSKNEWKVVQKMVDPIIKVKPAFKYKSISELMAIVDGFEAEKKRIKDELQKKHEAEIEKIKAESAMAASDEVSRDFIEKLKELAKK